MQPEEETPREHYLAGVFRGLRYCWYYISIDIDKALGEKGNIGSPKSLKPLKGGFRLFLRDAGAD